MAASLHRWSPDVIALVARHEVRRRWKGLLLLAAVTAVWAGAMLTAAAGARRTASALDGFVRTTSASEASFSIEEDRDGTRLLAAVQARPDVVGADSIWTAGTDLAYTKQGVWVMVAGGTNGSWRRDFDRPIVLSGRVADAAADDEVMVTSRTAALLGVAAGDHLSIPTWDRDIWYTWLKTRGAAYPPFNGPLIDVVITGVVRIDHDLHPTRDNEMVLATPAFVRRWAAVVGDERRTIVASFGKDAADPDAIATELSAKLGRSVDVTTRDEEYASQVSGATRALATGLWILAAAVLVAGGALIVLGYARETRHVAERYSPLAALGATSSQSTLAVAIPIVAAAFVGEIAAVAAATAASRWFPLGPGRLAEPFMTVQLDWVAVAAITGAIIIALSAAIRVGTAPVRSAPARPARLGRPLRFLDRLGAAPMAARSNSFGTRRRRATPFAAALIVAGFVAATWFSSSLNDLGHDPSRWGYTWSSSPEIGFEAGQFDRAFADTINTPGVAAITQHRFGTAFVDDIPVTVSWFESLRGIDVGVRVLAGTRPTAADEIALGEQTARRIHAQIGDLVQLRTAGWVPSGFRVVGLIVPPAIPGATSAGDGAFITTDGATAALPKGAATARLLFEYTAGSDRQHVQATLAARPGWVFDERAEARPPGDVANMLDVSTILGWLRAFFIVSGIAATVIAATRRSPRSVRELSILRAVGFTDRDMRILVTAEAAIVAVSGLVLGTAVGLALGSLMWRLAVGELGVDDSLASITHVAMSAGAVVAVATTLTSVLAARRARKISAVPVPPYD